MKYKKLLLIPVIFILSITLYANIMTALVENAETIRQTAPVTDTAGGEVIGVGQAISVKVTRATKPYLFGLVNLPGYAQGIGDLTTLHTAFFWSLYAFTIVLTIVFVIIERRQIKMKVSAPKMPFTKPNIWLKIGKSLGVGVLFALVAFLLSNDPSSIPLGLLAAYIEFRIS